MASISTPITVSTSSGIETRKTYISSIVHDGMQTYLTADKLSDEAINQIKER